MVMYVPSHGKRWSPRVQKKLIRGQSLRCTTKMSVEVGPGTTPGNGCPSNCKSYKDQKPKGVVVNLSEF
jgi:hypothetical protein